MRHLGEPGVRASASEAHLDSEQVICEKRMSGAHEGSGDRGLASLVGGYEPDGVITIDDARRVEVPSAATAVDSNCRRSAGARYRQGQSIGNRPEMWCVRRARQHGRGPNRHGNTLMAV